MLNDAQAPVRAVLFDAAGTLFTPQPSVPMILASIMAEAGHPVSAKRMADAKSRVESACGVPDDAPDRNTRLAYWTNHVLSVLDAAQVCAAPGTLAEVAHSSAQAITDPASYEIVPGVRSLLNDIDQAGLPKAIVSNFDDLLFDILDSLELSGHFDVVVTSFRFGVYKPDPAIFHEAAKRIRTPPRQIYFLGDSPYSDMQGAKHAGMMGVLYNPEGAKAGYTGRQVGSMQEFKRFIGL